jgi:hypothetical protein
MEPAYVGGAQGKVIPAPSPDAPPLLDEYRDFSNRLHLEGSYNHLENRQGFPVINTAACIYRKRALSDVGGFDPAFTRHEDSDLARKVYYAGYVLRSAPKASAKVLWGGDGWKDYIRSSFEAGFTKRTYDLAWEQDATRHLRNFLPLLKLNLQRLVLQRESKFLIKQGLQTLYTGGYLVAWISGRAPRAEVRELSPRSAGKLRSRFLPYDPAWRYILQRKTTIIADLKRGGIIRLSDKANDVFRFVLERSDGCQELKQVLARMAREFKISEFEASASYLELKSELQKLKIPAHSAV